MNSNEEDVVKKNSVSVYLLKKSIDFESALDQDKKPMELYRYSDNCIAYYRSVDAKIPKWLKDFLRLDDEKSSKSDFYSIDMEVINRLKTTSASAILLVKLEFQDGPRLFAIAFGYGRYLLADDVIEDRFGMKIALNSVNSDEIQGMKRTAIGTTLKNTIEQMPRLSNIYMFDINMETDLLKQITAKPSADFLKDCKIAGSNSLNTTANVDVRNISDFLGKCYNKYNETGYKENFEWIDHIQSVDSKDLIGKLDTELIEIFNKGGKEVWMAIPEIIDWEEVDYFTYGRKSMFSDIEVESFREHYGQFNDIDQLKRKKIEAIRGDGQLYKNWRAYNCFIAEIRLEDDYCLDDGKWYKVNRDFTDSIDKAYRKIPISNLLLPHCGEKEDEGEYNKRVSEQLGAFLADSNIIMHGGGQSKLELCDLIFDKRNMVHVKKYSSSSVMSHLFLQGVVSAESLNYDSTFRDKVISKFNKDVLDLSDNFDSSKYTVTYAIISNKDEEPPHLPFFSKVAVKNAWEKLKRMNYNVEIKTILYT